MNLLYRFLENTQVSNFMKIRSVGVEFHSDRRTNRHDESKVAFRNFSNAPKNASPARQYSIWEDHIGIAPLIRNLDTRWRGVVKFTPRTPKPRGQKSRCPLKWEIGRSRKKISYLYRDSNPESPRPQPSRYTNHASGARGMNGKI